MSKRQALSPLDAPMELLGRAAKKASLAAGAEARARGVSIAAREGELLDRDGHRMEQIRKRQEADAEIAAERKARQAGKFLTPFHRPDLHDD